MLIENAVAIVFKASDLHVV